MRYYLIDEISPADMKKIREFLQENALKSNLDGIFWVKIPPDLLTGEQYEHQGCQPHAFAAEVGSSWVKMECFVRSLKGMRCTCAGYCTEAQRTYVFSFTHNMIEQLGIKT